MGEGKWRGGGLGRKMWGKGGAKMLQEKNMSGRNLRTAQRFADLYLLIGM